MFWYLIFVSSYRRRWADFLGTAECANADLYGAAECPYEDLYGTAQNAYRLAANINWKVLLVFMVIVEEIFFAFIHT